MKRIGAAVLIGSVTFGSLLAFAASLGGVRSDTLGAGSATVASCDTNGVDTSYRTIVDRGAPQVVTVIVGGIDPACDDHVVSVQLVNAAGATLGSGTANTGTPSGTGDRTVAVNMTSPAAAEQVASIHVVISGGTSG